VHTSTLSSAAKERQHVLGFSSKPKQHLCGEFLPLCHSGLTCAQLPVPQSEYEGIEASKPEDLFTLYRAVADTLGSSVPEIDFEAFAKEVASFEVEYVKQRDLVTANSPLQESVEGIRNPKALCVSSPQFAKLGFENQLQTARCYARQPKHVDLVFMSGSRGQMG